MTFLVALSALATAMTIARISTSFKKAASCARRARIFASTRPALEAWLSLAAIEWLYGVLAVILATAVGGGASLVFRRV